MFVVPDVTVKWNPKAYTPAAGKLIVTCSPWFVAVSLLPVMVKLSAIVGYWKSSNPRKSMAVPPAFRSPFDSRSPENVNAGFSSVKLPTAALNEVSPDAPL
jgi:hypothetical protein